MARGSNLVGGFSCFGLSWPTLSLPQNISQPCRQYDARNFPGKYPGEWEWTSSWQGLKDGSSRGRERSRARTHFRWWDQRTRVDPTQPLTLTLTLTLTQNGPDIRLPHVRVFLFFCFLECSEVRTTTFLLTRVLRGVTRNFPANLQSAARGSFLFLKPLWGLLLELFFNGVVGLCVHAPVSLVFHGYHKFAVVVACW